MKHIADSTPAAEEQEPLTDFDAVNHAIQFYATLGHRTPAHAAIHALFTQARAGKELPVWRCFHCGETFTDPELARDHFGTDQLATPVCQIPDLAHLLRLQEYELRRYREEDSQVIRQVYALGADHHGKLRDEEEKGYAHGLKDGRGLADELVKQVRLLLENDGREGSYHAGRCFDARAEIVKLLKDFPE